MNPLRNVWIVTRAATLYAFAIGIVVAAVEIIPGRHVLEFQAGPGAPLGEKLQAIAQRAALEGVGFGALALVLGILAALLARLRRESFSAALVPVVGAFAAWVTVGSPLGRELVPLIPIGSVLLLDALGIGAALAALLSITAVARRLPAGKRTDPGVLAGAVVLATGVAVVAGLALARMAPGGWRSPLALVLGALPFAAAPVVAVAAARLGASAGAAIARAVAACGQPPRLVTRALALGLALCVAVGASSVTLSAVPTEISYPDATSTAPDDLPNVVFVVIDTLRADHLGCYGYPRETSTFLDGLAANGALFADATSPAPWTKPSTASLLTGLYPSRHGALYHGSRLGLPDGARTLADTFRRRGYATAGFVSNPNIKAIFDFDEGFEVFFDSPVEDTLTLACLRGSMFGKVLSGLTRHQFNWKYENDAKAINEHVFAWLEKNQDERFFLYIHYIDPHEPYAPPAEYAREFARNHEGYPLHNRRKELVGQDLYDAEIRYTDDQLAALVAELERHDAWEDTLFVLTSDHGEEWFEHGVLGHGFSLYQGVLGVPLVMHGAGIPSGVRVEEPVQTLDLPATLLELTGAETSRFGDGRSFAHLLDGPSTEGPRPIFIENEFGENEHDTRSFVLTGMRQGPYKLVLTEANKFRPPGAYPTRELYDLSSDPGESTNIFDDPDHMEAVRAMLEELTAHAAFLQQDGLRGDAAPTLSDDIRAQLEAMGYL